MRVDQNRSLIKYIVLTILTCGIYALFFLSNLAKDVNEMCKEDGKNTNGLLIAIILGIITCGIYPIIWYYGIAERIGDAQTRIGQAKDIDGTKYLLFCLVGAFVCGFVGLYGMHLLFKGANAVAAAHNETVG